MSRRSKQKTKCFEPEEVKLGEPKKSTMEISKTQVRLTENLLYTVNKKLKSKDKAARDQTLKATAKPEQRDNDMEPTEPFTEVLYRNRSDLNLSQTQLAVMHDSYFKSNSIAVCELDSMEAFLHAVGRARFRTSSRDFKDLLWLYRYGHVKKLKNPVARFLQLPKEYCRPHSECLYLGELAFKLNQDQGWVMTNCHYDFVIFKAVSTPR